jgi:hypothetical protein
MAYINKQFPNISYQLSGGMNFLGSVEFIKVMTGQELPGVVEVV